MSKKRRDQIINMAFGDVDTDGLSYENLTEEERVELESLKELKHGLKSLHEIPDCQLSSERLRSAILSGAVKKRPAQYWSFATGTIAFFAVALIAFNAGLLDKETLSASNKINVSDPIEVINDPFDISHAGATSSGLTAAIDNEIVANDNSNDTGPNSEVITELVGSYSDPNSADNDWNYALNNNRTEDYVPFTAINYYPADDVEITVAYQPGSGVSTGSLIVVSNSIEDVYGAYEATEVETYGDVVFGG